MAGRIITVDDSDDSDCEMMFSYMTNDKENEFAKAVEKYRAVNQIQDTSSTDLNVDVNGHGNSFGHSSNNSQNSQTTIKFNSHQKKPMQHNIIVEELLSKACLRGDVDAVRKAISEGEDVNSVMVGNWTPLMYASSGCSPNLVEYLLEEGADPNYSYERFTVLMALCSSNIVDEERNVQCFKLLCDHGANLDNRDTYLMTPLMFACKFGKFALVKEFLEKKVSLDVQDCSGWSALTWAASKGYGAIVRILLEAGAHPRVISTAGMTPADVAREKEFDSIASLLDSYSNGTSHREFSGDGHQKKSIIKKISEVDTILDGLNLSHLRDLFDEHKVSLEVYLALEEKDLDMMGIDKIGDRHAILDSIKTLHKERWEKSSLSDAHRGNYISCPDAVAMIANIGCHLKLINSTVRYIRNRIKNDPSMLEVGKESVHVKSFYLQSILAQKYSTVLTNEFIGLNKELRKVENYLELLPADVIGPKSSKRWQSKGLICVVSCCGIVCTLLYLLKTTKH